MQLWGNWGGGVAWEQEPRRKCIGSEKTEGKKGIPKVTGSIIFWEGKGANANKIEMRQKQG